MEACGQLRFLHLPLVKAQWCLNASDKVRRERWAAAPSKRRPQEARPSADACRALRCGLALAMLRGRRTRAGAARQDAREKNQKSTTVAFSLSRSAAFFRHCGAPGTGADAAAVLKQAEAPPRARPPGHGHCQQMLTVRFASAFADISLHARQRHAAPPPRAAFAARSRERRAWAAGHGVQPAITRDSAGGKAPRGARRLPGVVGSQSLLAPFFSSVTHRSFSPSCRCAPPCCTLHAHGSCMTRARLPPCRAFRPTLSLPSASS